MLPYFVACLFSGTPEYIRQLTSISYITYLVCFLTYLNKDRLRRMLKYSKKYFKRFSRERGTMSIITKIMGMGMICFRSSFLEGTTVISKLRAPIAFNNRQDEIRWR